jgi:hypothetical protein
MNLTMQLYMYIQNLKNPALKKCYFIYYIYLRFLMDLYNLSEWVRVNIRK